MFACLRPSEKTQRATAAGFQTACILARAPCGFKPDLPYRPRRRLLYNPPPPKQAV
ncbi:hypothetical protein HMPREF9123_0791 [Neisseria bacilliformis ATCC BAA-1200]|uniref:Uncharacterized protein n=1 Tax=Neisseria bacilliformis ATCC BAA-1200 TaxID=888742 RepID=F2BAF9_9NEIS|nr:hypothetical protein HMPREF9123_0791 [Neisseria bacilliformis ATCC BAA-1200]